MYTISHQYNRWRISKGHRIVLSGIGSIQAGLEIAKLHDIVLSEFALPSLRVA